MTAADHNDSTSRQPAPEPGTPVIITPGELIGFIEANKTIDPALKRSLLRALRRAEPKIILRQRAFAAYEPAYRIVMKGLEALAR